MAHRTGVVTVGSTHTLIYENTSGDRSRLRVNSASVPQPFVKWLRDGETTIDMAVDGSVTPVVYNYTAPSGQIVELGAIKITVVDSGYHEARKFGAMLELTNGCDLEVVTAAGTADFFDGHPPVTNAEMGGFVSDYKLYNIGAGEDISIFTWELPRTVHPVTLHPGDEVRLRVNDDLTGLNRMKATIHGDVWAPPVYLGPAGVTVADGYLLQQFGAESTQEMQVAAGESVYGCVEAGTHVLTWLAEE